VDNVLNINCSKLLQEILVGSAFAQVKRNLLSDAVSLARYLPITISRHNIPLEIKVITFTLNTIVYIASYFLNDTFSSRVIQCDCVFSVFIHILYSFSLFLSIYLLLFFI